MLSVAICSVKIQFCSRSVPMKAVSVYLAHLYSSLCNVFLTVCTVMLVLLDNKLIKSSLVLFSCCSYLEQVTKFMGTDPMLAPLDLWIQGNDPLISNFKQMFYRNTIYLNFFKAKVWIIAY